MTHTTMIAVARVIVVNNGRRRRFKGNSPGPNVSTFVSLQEVGGCELVGHSIVRATLKINNPSAKQYIFGWLKSLKF